MDDNNTLTKSRGSDGVADEADGGWTSQALVLQSTERQTRLVSRRDVTWIETMTMTMMCSRGSGAVKGRATLPKMLQTGCRRFGGLNSRSLYLGSE